MKKFIYPILLLLFFSFDAKAEKLSSDEIIGDSLISIIKTADNDSVKFANALHLFRIYKEKEFSEKIIKYAIDLAQSNNMTNELCHAYNELAYIEIIKNGVNERSEESGVGIEGR